VAGDGRSYGHHLALWMVYRKLCKIAQAMCVHGILHKNRDIAALSQVPRSPSKSPLWRRTPAQSPNLIARGQPLPSSTTGWCTLRIPGLCWLSGSSTGFRGDFRAMLPGFITNRRHGLRPPVHIQTGCYRARRKSRRVPAVLRACLVRRCRLRSSPGSDQRYGWWTGGER
jgi:hypothetical protein